MRGSGQAADVLTRVTAGSGETDHDAAAAATPTVTPPPAPTRWAVLRSRAAAFVVRNFLLLGFAFALLVALTWPLPGRTLGAWQLGSVRALQAFNNAFVFLVSGLTLEGSELRALSSDWRGPLVGLVAILGVTPCLGFAVLRLPLRPHDFAVGLAIFAVVPTTLGVGVALTAAARGNQALALALTVSTNLLGIASVPYFLRAVLASMPGGSSVQLDASDLATKLVYTVLLPSLAGQAARRASARVARWVTAHRTLLSLFSHSNLVCIVWLTLSAASGVLLHQRAGDVFAVLAAAAGMHLALLLAMHVLCARVLRLPPRERVAVVIMSAQKSAPVAVAVITYITSSAEQQGLLAIPALLGQVTQILLGSALARTLARQVRSYEAALESEADAPAERAAGGGRRSVQG